MKILKTIYDLALNETLGIDNNTDVTRVAGGWIYSFYSDSDDNRGYSISTTFVPYNEEFKEKEKTEYKACKNSEEDEECKEQCGNCKYVQACQMISA